MPLGAVYFQTLEDARAGNLFITSLYECLWTFLEQSPLYSGFQWPFAQEYGAASRKKHHFSQRQETKTCHDFINRHQPRWKSPSDIFQKATEAESKSHISIFQVQSISFWSTDSQSSSASSLFCSLQIFQTFLVVTPAAPLPECRCAISKKVMMKRWRGRCASERAEERFHSGV